MPCRIMPRAKCGLDAMRVTDLDRPTREMRAGAALMMMRTTVVGALAGRAAAAALSNGSDGSLSQHLEMPATVQTRGTFCG